jgi:hypothetical protein
MDNCRMSRLTAALLLCIAIALSGCATLEVTPQQGLKPAAPKLPVAIGIQASGERLRSALTAVQDPVVVRASGSLFDKVELLPPEARFRQPAEVRSAHGTDYILTVAITDINVHGNLNPYWFLSMPLFFFKPYAPIVTFDATVTLETSLVDARTGTVIMQKEVSENVTDHYSPMDAEDKVRSLITRCINNAFVGLLEEVRSKIANNAQKK